MHWDLEQFEKLRRSAMSIADNAPWFLLKLRRSGMLFDRSWGEFRAGPPVNVDEEVLQGSTGNVPRADRILRQRD